MRAVGCSDKACWMLWIVNEGEMMDDRRVGMNE